MTGSQRTADCPWTLSPVGRLVFLKWEKIVKGRWLLQANSDLQIVPMVSNKGQKNKPDFCSALVFLYSRKKSLVSVSSGFKGNFFVLNISQ